MNTEKQTISNQPHEIKTAAKTMGVYPDIIMLAKRLSGSNERRVVYDWLWNNADLVKQLKGWVQ